MALCLDASAVVAALLPRPPSPAAAVLIREAIQAGERLVAPPLLYAETTAVLRRYVHTGAITHGEAVAALQDVFRLPISALHRAGVYLRALELARELGHARAYDVQYLAVAEIETCPVITLDRGLHQSARTLGIASRLIA